MSYSKKEGALPHGICSPYFVMFINWITPKKIVQDSLWGYFSESIDQLYLSNFFELWRDSTMYREILLIDNCAKRQHLKDGHDFLVNLLIVFAET